MLEDLVSQRRLSRALDDLRRGEPVHIAADQMSGFVVAIERLQAPALEQLKQAGAGEAMLILSQERAKALSVPLPKGGGAIAWPSWTPIEELIAIADPVYDLATPQKGPFKAVNIPEGVAKAALSLAKLGELLPAAVWVPAQNVTPTEVDCFSVTPAQIDNGRVRADVQEVVHAKVPLAQAQDCRVHAFNVSIGHGEHLALVIGAPDPTQPVLTRLHSECLTGDVLGSLKCDCGDQLRGALAAISKAESGVLLYLAQEGRGIGLMNKLRAYNLQDQGYDTVDANLRLGFATDERHYGIAAGMLQALGYQSIRLMTNNPLKIQALEEFGLDVVERVAHSFETNPHNVGYMETKKARTGHLL